MAKSEKATRAPVWEAGETPNKTNLKKLAKEFQNAEGRKSGASLADFCVENDLSVEALVSLSTLALEKDIDENKAATLRRAALRKANGGPRVVRKKSEAKPKAAAKGKGKGKGKASAAKAA